MRILQFIPRGTETIPALLKPRRESILNEEALRALGGYDHGSGPDVSHHITFERDAFKGIVVDSPERAEQLANKIVQELRAQRRHWVEDDDGA